MRSSQISIRSFRRSDAPAVTRLMKSLGAHHGDDLSFLKPSHFLTTCLGPKKTASCWVAVHASKIMGFAVCHDLMNFVRGVRVRHLELLYVDEKQRGKSVGTQLVFEVLQSAKKKGIKRFTVSAQKNNKKAKVFYLSLGFKARPPTDKNDFVLEE